MKLLLFFLLVAAVLCNDAGAAKTEAVDAGNIPSIMPKTEAGGDDGGSSTFEEVQAGRTDKVQALLKKLDSDGDGKVSMRELSISFVAKAVHHLDDAEVKKDWKEKHLSNLEKADLSDPETKKIYDAFSEGELMEELKAMIGKVDQDGDGHIDVNEMSISTSDEVVDALWEHSEL